MRNWIIAVIALVIAIAVFWGTRTDLMFGGTETKGAADLTEWVKLGISMVSLAIGVVNLRMALAKEKS